MFFVVIVSIPNMYSLTQNIALNEIRIHWSIAYGILWKRTCISQIIILTFIEGAGNMHYNEEKWE